MKTLIISILLSLFLVSCTSEKKNKPVFVDVNYDDDQDADDDLIIVPFRVESGVKIIDVKINGMSVEMIFDTGCSATLISIAEANYLYQKGELTEDDYRGNLMSQIADGSVVENMIFNLREVIIDDKLICYDVLATVSSNVNAPLLLGNEVLDRVATYTIDNDNQTINFRLK